MHTGEGLSIKWAPTKRSEVALDTAEQRIMDLASVDMHCTL